MYTWACLALVHLEFQLFITYLPRFSAPDQQILIAALTKQYETDMRSPHPARTVTALVTTLHSSKSLLHGPLDLPALLHSLHLHQQQALQVLMCPHEVTDGGNNTLIMI